MKKIALKAVVAAAFALCAPSAQAQSDILNDVLGAIAGQQSGTVGAVLGSVGKILGTTAVSEQSLVGTWNYSQPCVAFESDNLLNQIGAEFATKSVQKKLKKGLDKAGIKAGKCSITFDQDRKFTFVVGGKTQQGTYVVNGSTLTMTFALTGRQIEMNVKHVGNTLQLAMNADKMLQMVNTVATKASAYSSQMGSVAALLGKYNGMYLGMELTR